MLADFKQTGVLDPNVIVASKHDNYHAFLAKIKETEHQLSESQNKILKFLCREILPSRRMHEIVLLQELLVKQTLTITEKKGYLNIKGYISLHVQLTQ